MSSNPETTLPMSLRVEDVSTSPEMQALVSGRIDLRRVPQKGKLRCGVDPLGASRAVRADPRSNQKPPKRKTPKGTDHEARQLWLSHPLLRDVWLTVWVSPSVWEIAHQLSIFWKLEPVDRDDQLVVGVQQRISDLRMLGVVISSTLTENHRKPNGAEVAGYELLSGILTDPPPARDTVLDFTAELYRLCNSDEAQKAVFAEIDRQARERRTKAEKRIAKAVAAMSPATASNDNSKEKGAA